MVFWHLCTIKLLLCLLIRKILSGEKTKEIDNLLKDDVYEAC